MARPFNHHTLRTQKSAPNEYDERLARLMMEWRKKKKLSQREVADHFGFSSTQFISNIERGLACPPANSIREFAKLYEVRPEKIVNLLVERFRTNLMLSVNDEYL